MDNAGNRDSQSLQRAQGAECHHTIHRILVVVDPAAVHHPCIEKGARLASNLGSTLELYVCDSDDNVPESWTPLSQYRSILRDRRLAMLEALAAPLRERGIRVTTESEWHAPPEQGIVEHAIRVQADLVLKDVHRREPTSYMPLDPTDRMLVRNLPMPLLLVRPRAWPEHPLVAACVDPCHGAERSPLLDESLCAMTTSIGRALAGEVSMLHALEAPVHLADEALERTAIEADYQRQRAAVAEVASRACVSIEALRFEEGHFPESLIQMVKREKSDLLVIGAVARRRASNDSEDTAWRVLEQTDSDLLVVKPGGFVGPASFSDG